MSDFLDRLFLMVIGCAVATATADYAGLNWQVGPLAFLTLSLLVAQAKSDV